MTYSFNILSFFINGGMSNKAFWIAILGCKSSLSGKQSQNSFQCPAWFEDKLDTKLLTVIGEAPLGGA